MPQEGSPRIASLRTIVMALQIKELQREGTAGANTLRQTERQMEVLDTCIQEEKAKLKSVTISLMMSSYDHSKLLLLSRTVWHH